MIQISDKQLFGKIIADSLVRVDSNQTLNTKEKLRWVNAIGKAVVKLEENGVFMTWQEDKETLLIWSDSNEIYEANGVCQCKAFLANQPCWHKSAKRLYQLYLKALAPAPEVTGAAFAADANYRAEMANAMYYKPEVKSEKIQGFRI